jgi:alpha-L-rhamnosidase
LKTKLHSKDAGADGLILSGKAAIKNNDVVDWPPGERDGFVFRPVNTVVNAFYLRSLAFMAELAHTLHHDADAATYTAREQVARAAFESKLFDPERGLYRDGEGASHISSHANLFPMAFGIVPPEHRGRVAHWLGDRGMVCSVYAAQYLLEGLFENDMATQALTLITAATDRSWKHMVDSGTTITWEAWDQRYKSNQDWNHAWGAAPANLLPRYVLGARVLSPGWTRAGIRPNPGSLTWAEGKVPTPRGPVFIRWESGDTFKLSLTLPRGMSAQVQLPASKSSQGVFLNGQPVSAHRNGLWWTLEQDVTGAAAIEAR